MRTHVCVHTYACTCMRAHVCEHMYAYTCMRVDESCMRAHVCVHMNVCRGIRAHVCVQMHAHTGMRIHVLVHMYACTCMRAYVCVHMYAYTCMRAHVCLMLAHLGCILAPFRVYVGSILFTFWAMLTSSWSSWASSCPMTPHDTTQWATCPKNIKFLMFYNGQTGGRRHSGLTSGVEVKRQFWEKH